MIGFTAIPVHIVAALMAVLAAKGRIGIADYMSTFRAFVIRTVIRTAVSISAIIPSKLFACMQQFKEQHYIRPGRMSS